MSDWQPYEMLRQGYILKDYRVVYGSVHGSVRDTVHGTDNNTFKTLVEQGYLPCGDALFQCVSGSQNVSKAIYCESRQPMCLWESPAMVKWFILDNLKR